RNLGGIKHFFLIMDLPLFHPSATRATDTLAGRLRSIAHYLLIAAFGLSPLLFIPSAYLPFSAGKTIVVMAIAVVAMLFLVMSVLRNGSLTIRFPLVLVGVWAIAATTFASALLSGDLRDSLFGDG